MSATKDVFMLTTTGRPFAAMLGGMALACLLPAAACGASSQVAARLLPNSMLSLIWTGQSGRYYRIQFKTDLADPVWRDVPGEIEGCDYGNSRILLTTNQPQRFFRIVDIGDTSSFVPAYPDPSGNWVMFHRFTMELPATYTNDIFVTASGFALQRLSPVPIWEVFDGPATDNAALDQRIVYADLMADSRVVWANPGRTVPPFFSPLYYDNVLLTQLRPPFSDIGSLLAEQHLSLIGYFAFVDTFLVGVTNKTDDAFIIAQRLQGDPRLNYIEVDGYGEPRDGSCIAP